MLASFRMSVSAGCGDVGHFLVGTISTKEKADCRADRLGLPMKSSRNLSCCVATAFALLSFGLAAQAQSYPSYVVDAQLPIVSSDGFNDPHGLATAPGGIVYVADSGNHRLLKFSLSGTQTTVGFGAFGPAANTMSGLATDAVGDLFVADTATNRLIKLPAGGGHAITIMDAPLMDRPTAVASDSAGDVAVVNSGNATVVVRRYGPASVFNTGSTVLVAPTAVALDNQGLVYIADAGNGTTPGAVYKFPSAGGTGTAVALTGYGLKNVTGMVLDDQRNLYVLDAGSEQLIEVPASGGSPFLIPQSNFKSPSGLALDNLGNIYVSDSGAASNTVTKFAYNNAANFGSVAVGEMSKPITFNYEFYERTIVEATRGFGGGVLHADYHTSPGGNCGLVTYYPKTSSTGLTLPASCVAKFYFQPLYVGGRPGAVQLLTSNGNVNQLVNGIGLGGQLALLNAAITKLVASNVIYAAVNSADTEIYFSTAAGTYRMPVGGGTPTLVTTQTGISLALDGLGDLFLLNPPTITKIPADGSASTVMDIPELDNPQAMVMDANDVIYITNLTNRDDPHGFVLRVSPAGVVSKLPGYWVGPSAMTIDGEDNIYVLDGYTPFVYKIQVGIGLYTQIDTGLESNGNGGAFPVNLMVDASGTLYWWNDVGGILEFDSQVAQISSPGNLFPLYTITGIPDNFGFLPFVPSGEMITSPSGKMYVVYDGALFLIDRTLGSIPRQYFDPNVFSGGNPQTASVMNIGNQNVIFTDPTRAFTESGNGVGSFTFGASFTNPLCQSGVVLIPGSSCLFGVSNGAGQSPPVTGPTVTDTLHLLTNAANNNAVSFKLSGVANPAP
jgi:sugar lactone lactonase YvrE